MCGNIKKLRYEDRQASDEELYKAALQFIRKVSDYRKPSQQNEELYNRSVENIAKILGAMLRELN